MRIVPFLFSLTLFGESITAQLNLLTLREAEAIVERLPAIMTAQKEGHCPMLAGSYQGQDGVEFQVRDGCGSTKGMLIETYRVNRRTGVVTTSGEIPALVGDNETRLFARRLVSNAQTRVLSMEEAKCLAEEAAKGLKGWNTVGSSISVAGGSVFGQNEVHFTVWNHSASRPADRDRGLDVGVATGRVRDYETGWDVTSGGLGALTALIFELRHPPLLTDEDALSIALALRLPSFTDGFRRGCRLYTAGPFRSDETEVGLSCGDNGKSTATAVAVNVKTGKVIDADSGNVLESEESTQLAQKLLEERRTRNIEVRTQVSSVCAKK